MLLVFQMEDDEIYSYVLASLKRKRQLTADKLAFTMLKAMTGRRSKVQIQMACVGWCSMPLKHCVKQTFYVVFYSPYRLRHVWFYQWNYTGCISKHPNLPLRPVVPLSPVRGTSLTIDQQCTELRSKISVFRGLRQPWNASFFLACSILLPCVIILLHSIVIAFIH